MAVATCRGRLEHGGLATPLSVHASFQQ